MDLLGKYPKTVLEEMMTMKLEDSYKRPSFLDIWATFSVIISKRSVCLFHDVGAVIFRDKQILSIGYNGPSVNDDHCNLVGCSRIENEEIKKNVGKCRGTHAEINAIINAAKNGIDINNTSIMVSLFPCFQCAKQLANTVKEVYYIFDYNLEEKARVEKYLKSLDIKITRYESEYLTKWTGG